MLIIKFPFTLFINSEVVLSICLVETAQKVFNKSTNTPLC